MNLQDLALGTEPRQRLRIRRMLSAALVHALSLLLQWQAVWAGQSDARAASWLSIVLVLGVGLFYVAVRSGFSLRFADPALTMPQMVFALLALALAYLINAHVRGTLLMVVALVLVFGAFTLTQQRCQRLGWIAVVLLAGAMLCGALLDPARFAPQIEAVNFVFMAVVLPTIATLAGQLSRLRTDQQRHKRELQEAVQRLNEMATHDELTGLVNRRHVRDWITHEVAREKRQGTMLCMALIDLDHFKRLNDTLGHAQGDAVLRIFSRECRHLLREVDILARWGGEEFLLVMPDTTLDEGRRALERLREHLALDSVWAECPQGRVTFSAGLTTLPHTQSLDKALQRADALLYAAKDQGRNRTVAD